MGAEQKREGSSVAGGLSGVAGESATAPAVYVCRCGFEGDFRVMGEHLTATGHGDMVAS